ncbi:hypothetical protein FAM09_21170 [Niastella caeni]|uniref:Outer membrane protein beta-barrel domain-containing protein n=1 Tax=Niastella caeni TaxID=2569763 RepID=A0A4S8HL76_9BACT|nr:hypothetical protein [Niastella caeni]THU35905.1 hypothetical protein FAM09_21170 [Niastella caeni]
MYIKLLLFVVLTGVVLISSAQEAKQEQPVKKGCSCSFSSINQIGVLNGGKGAYFEAQTINGVRYKTWFAGIGVGLDYYFRHGYPVFLDVRKDLLDKPFTPFFYIDGGFHLVNKKIVPESRWYQNVYSNGFYGGAGVGYKVGFRSKFRVLASAGYSYKNVTRKYENVLGCGTPCWEHYYTYKNYLHRFSMKLGVQF